MKISKEEKQRIKAERQRVHDIIKYDVNRKYFGDWTPDGLNATYNSPTPVNFYTGILSVDKICDALWNEMSYNPERFGTGEQIPRAQASGGDQRATGQGDGGGQGVGGDCSGR